MGLFDWIRDRVNNRKPVPEERQMMKVEERMTEENHVLKFYENRKGRFAVQYNRNHLCLCDKDEKEEVEKYFRTHYKGDNLEEISTELKKRYNQKIYANRKYVNGKKRTGGKRKGKRGRKPKSYRENRLQFQEKNGGRIQIRVSDKGRVHTICQCYPDQKEEAIRRYELLKRNHSLDEIKVVMKNDYNIQRKNKDRGISHNIQIDSNGTCYKDGKLCKIDPEMYDTINRYL